jgi:UDP-2,3-diacylglucosamine pyrophosphatase LpxH
MTRANIRDRLQALLAVATPFFASPQDRIVIFSDLHLGDGGTRDDFAHNAALFSSVLNRHYLGEGFNLVLNGDIEDLHKFPAAAICSQWRDLYRTFHRFACHASLHKIIGNHDHELSRGHGPGGIETHEALDVRYGEQRLLIFHGHQAGRAPQRFHPFEQFALRWIATPLGFMNFDVSHNDMKKFAIEQRVYDFARREGLVSIIGHTHRPLFESMSKRDCLKIEMEQSFRQYVAADAAERQALSARIHELQMALHRSLCRANKHQRRAQLYGGEETVPCVFNSGCAIGKRGISAIEIVEGRIALVHWFDSLRCRKYLTEGGHETRQLGNSSIYKVILKDESLDYIFARLNLLGANVMVPN